MNNKQKLFLLLAIFTLSLKVKVQAQNPIPNYNFETWSIDSMFTFDSSFVYDYPNGWFPLFSAFYWGFNSGPGHLSCYKSTDKYAGNYGMQLTVDSDSAGADMMTVFPLNYRPLHLNGYYKFNGLPGDTFALTLGIVKGDALEWLFGDTSVIEIGTANLSFPLTSGTAYQPFSVPIVYNSVPDVPDSALIVIYADGGSYGSFKPGRQLWIDMLSFSGIAGMDEELLKNSIMFYPNPVSVDLTIDFGKDILGNTEIEILDITGRNVLSQKIETSTNNIDMSSYENGVYIFRIKTNDKVFTKKIIKE